MDYYYYDDHYNQHNGSWGEGEYLDLWKNKLCGDTTNYNIKLSLICSIHLIFSGSPPQGQDGSVM